MGAMVLWFLQVAIIQQSVLKQQKHKSGDGNVWIGHQAGNNIQIIKMLQTGL